MTCRLCCLQSLTKFDIVLIQRTPCAWLCNVVLQVGDPVRQGTVGQLCYAHVVLKKALRGVLLLVVPQIRARLTAPRLLSGPSDLLLRDTLGVGRMIEECKVANCMTILFRQSPPSSSELLPLI